MNINALRNTLSSRARALPVVILYVTEGCNLRCITCSYREALPEELTLAEIEALAADLSGFGLKHIVFSGGEPLLRKDFPRICETFSTRARSRTLLTNGLLLAKRIGEIGKFLTGIIVSLDGASAGVHHAIRGVESFDAILKGISAAAGNASRPDLSLRTVVQKKNFRDIFRIVDLGHTLGVDRVSFLAADVYSSGFGRDTRGAASPGGEVMLSRDEVAELRELIGEFRATYENDFRSHFIAESPEKLLHIADYYDALLGNRPFPRNRCNAPMVSAVIGARGEILPCFFLPSYGNIRERPFSRLVNDPAIRRVRRDVRDYVPDRCHTCVCTLHVPPRRALNGLF